MQRQTPHSHTHNRFSPMDERIIIVSAIARRKNSRKLELICVRSIHHDGVGAYEFSVQFLLISFSLFYWLLISLHCCALIVAGNFAFSVHDGLWLNLLFRWIDKVRIMCKRDEATLTVLIFSERRILKLGAHFYVLVTEWNCSNQMIFIRKHRARYIYIKKEVFYECLCGFFASISLFFCS